MILAMRVTRSDLRMPLIETDAEWVALMELLLTKHRDAVAEILAAEGFSEVTASIE